MSESVKFRFGVELEVVTGSRAQSHMDWHSVAAVLSQELNTVGINNHVNAYHKDKDESYLEWSLIQEVTITNQMMQNKWGMELVSPILDFQRPDVWHAHLDSVWWVLDTKFQTSATDQCSTHIHISPTEGKWTLIQLKKIAKAVIYFERSIDSLLPHERRANMWCRSNRWNETLKEQSMSTVFEWIDGVETIWHLSFLMCFFSKNSDYGKATGAQNDFAHNVFRWNFTPLSEDAKGTIEFRQPPGSSSATQTKVWVQFVASFIQGAIQYGDSLNPQNAPTLKLLEQYLLAGAKSSKVLDSSQLRNLFIGRSLLPSGAYDLKYTDPDSIKKMKTKASEQNISLAKFKKLYGYK